MDDNTKIIFECMEQEISWLKELNELLAKEKIVLATRQFEHIEEIANKKNQLSNDLEASNSRRIAVMSEGNPGSIKVSIHDFIKKCSPDDSKKINKLNKNLAEQLAICRELNTINGQVIATNLHTRQQIVNILSNKTDEGTVYTAAGTLKSSTTTDPSHQKEA